MNVLNALYAGYACNTSSFCIDTSAACTYSPSMDFHKRIRKLRKDLDLSYQAIADACGVKWQTVQQWCKDEAEGGTYPKIDNLEPLARLLKTTPWYLLWGVEVGANPPIKEAKTPLSDQADELIQCVIRLDKAGDPARKTFAHHTALLRFADEITKVQDSDVVRQLLEQERLLAPHEEPIGAQRNATRKHK